MGSLDADEVIGDLGYRISELRSGLSLTQSKMAELMEVSIQYYQRIEYGTENLTIRSLIRIANILGVGVNDLFVPPSSRETKRGRPARTKE